MTSDERLAVETLFKNLYRKQRDASREENDWLWDRLMALIGKVTDSPLDGSGFNDMYEFTHKLATECSERLQGQLSQP